MGHHNFSSRTNRSAFSLKELLVVVTVIGVLLALALPAIQKQREDHRIAMCQNNLKQIGLGLQSYEDKRKCLPPISTNTDEVPDIPGDPSDTTDAGHPKPGSAPSSGAGYSWHVLLLYETISSPLYQSIVATSKDFTRSAFSKELIVGNVHPATIALEYFRCPSFSGGSTLDMSPRTVGNARGAIETGTIPPNYVGGIATAGGAKGLAITNYNAILGTHVDPVDTNDSKKPTAGSVRRGSTINGAMQFAGTAFNKARGMAAFSDGKANTVIVAETRERRFASWFDGTMNWVVAPRHSDLSNGAVAIIPANMGPPELRNRAKLAGRWVVGAYGSKNSGGSALNYGPTRQTPTAVYLPTESLADPDISGIPPGRLWGPSSEHRDGIVNHAFADGHVESISDKIDPNIYLWLTTRNGGE